MAEFEPVFETPLPAGESRDADPELWLTDESKAAKHRVFGEEGYEDVPLGHARRTAVGLVYSVSPGEWTIHDGTPTSEVRTVDLTHVRAAVRLTGPSAADVLAKLCALDFDERMFPNGAATRTSVAAVATEIVRDDQAGASSYLLVPSRSFGRYLHGALMEAGREFGLQHVE